MPTSAILFRPGTAERAASARRVLAWKLLDRLRFWSRRARQRRALARLDDRLLRDIGLTRHQAERAARKPFWRN